MDVLPADHLLLLLTVFVLGCRHGLDPDHLAAIDGLARYSAETRPRVSRWAGLLFSLGHGLAVLAVVTCLAFLVGQWQVPQWTATAGVWCSAGVLVLLGILNLRAVIWQRHPSAFRPLSLKGQAFARLFRTSHPALILVIGALFALSFDTLSLAALFTAAAGRLAGSGWASVLGLVFMLGMLLPDALNGAWMARLLQRRGGQAQRLSRCMGTVIALLSLVVGGLEVAAWWSPRVAPYLATMQVLCVVGAASSIILLVLWGRWQQR